MLVRFVFVLFFFSLSFDADILCCDDSLCSIDALWTTFLNSSRTHTIIYVLILFDDKWIFIEHNSLIKGKKRTANTLNDVFLFFSILLFELWWNVAHKKIMRLMRWYDWIHPKTEMNLCVRSLERVCVFYFGTFVP